MDLLHDLGMDSFSTRMSNLHSKVYDKAKHNALSKKEITSTHSFPENFPPIILDRKPDGIWELSYIIASQWFKNPVSEFCFTASEINYDFVEYLQNNATLILRSGYQSSADVNYLFLYKNVFFNISTGTKEDDEKLVITGISLYYTIEHPIPYEEVEKFMLPKEPEKPKIGIIKQGRGGMYVSKLNLSHNQTFSFDYYNEDFVEFEDRLVNLLSEKKPGLFLLHGEPGTGKSSAIRHLVEKVKRNFIFIPPQMISHLSSPEFADIITDSHKGSVLILEDAEKALMKRESDDGFSNSTLVSSVLNLTDGLYADLGQLAIIATYNCDRNLIDSALLRKGRLKAEYRFNKLEKERAQSLADKLEKDMKISEAMTLADIFNHEQQYSNNEREKKRAIGFGFGG
jgi:hypothetical protein